MRERLFIVLSLVLIVGALIGLNAASFVQTEREPDDEARPKNSSFNAGASGTRAFYEFLSETGRSVSRWQDRPAALLSNKQIKTFVVAGTLRREFETKDAEDLLKWTANGGRLVIISRSPDKKLLPKSGEWKLDYVQPLGIGGDSSNVNEMTKDVAAARPSLPSVLTTEVNAVMPSKFASNIILRREEPTGSAKGVSNDSSKISTNSSPKSTPPPVNSNTVEHGEDADDDESDVDEDDGGNENYNANAAPSKPSPTPVKVQSATSAPIKLGPGKMVDPTAFPAFAPVVHLTSNDKNVLADYQYGAGRVVFLSDPYIVSNGGLSLADNLQLGLNVVAANEQGATIAFDEFHHGYGAGGNALLQFFENTPLPAIAAQIGLLVLFAVYTKGKRFARPVPLPNPDRRSKLEYVGAMAELQRRTGAFDLAIENVYGRVRRNLARFVGADNKQTTPDALAKLVSERSKLDRAELQNLFRDCEDIICGEKTTEKRALSLVAKLRDIERQLGFRK